MVLNGLDKNQLATCTFVSSTFHFGALRAFNYSIVRGGPFFHFLNHFIDFFPPHAAFFFSKTYFYPPWDSLRVWKVNKEKEGVWGEMGG